MLPLDCQRQPRVLLIEDDLVDAMAIRHAFEAATGRTPELHTACSLSAALVLLRAERFDLVLCDLTLPDAGGGQAVQRLKEEFPDLPQVVVSASGQGAIEAAIRAGARACLEKSSLDPEELQRTVQLVIGVDRAARQFLQLVNTSEDGMIVLDGAQRVRFLNPAAEELLARSREELEGAALPFQLREGRLELRGEEATRTFDARITSVEWEGQPATLLTLRDLSDQLRLQLRLQEAERLEAVGRLAASVAHDFNNMLATILWNVELLLDEVGDELRPTAEAAKVGTWRAAELTGRLLDFARERSLRPDRLDAQALLQETAKLLPSLIPAGVELDVQLCAEPLWVRVDRGQLQQALFNLGKNAGEAMPSGGRLSLILERVHLGRSEARTRGMLTAGEFAQIRVADTGIGIKEELRRRVFEPFFTTRHTEGGVGLGLASVHDFVGKSGGVIECESQVGAGTTFRLLFPASPEPSPIAEAAPGPPRVFKPGKGRILLAEDDVSIREALTMFLSGLGYEVLAAANGREALDLYVPAQPLDLLVTDVDMPELDGEDLADELRRRQPGLPVLFMTAFSVQRLRGETLPPWAGFIQKPFGCADFLTQVEGALQPNPAS